MCIDHDSAPPIAAGATRLPAGGACLLTADDGAPVRAYAARAAAPTGAGVVVLPDLRGLHPFYETLAEHLAEAGYDAVALDYYGRTAGTGARGDDFAFLDYVSRLQRDQLQADLAAGVAFLRAPIGGACKSVYTLGFCMGGRLSFLAATQGLDLAGVVGFYGAPRMQGPYRDPGPAQLAHRITAPVLALMGGADEGIPLSEVEAFRSALVAAGVVHEVIVYPDAPHGFFDLKHAEYADACANAWRRTLAFFAGARPPAGERAPRSD